MVKKATKNLLIKDIEKLLGQQTGVILDAVDDKIQKVDSKIHKIDSRMLGMENRMDNLERRMSSLEKSMDELRNTLDKFLKKLTDFNDEFKIVKARLSRLEKIIQEKLGVTID